MEQIVGKAKDKEKGQKKKEKEPETDAAVCEKFGLPAGEVFIKSTREIVSNLRNLTNVRNDSH